MQRAGICKEKPPQEGQIRRIICQEPRFVMAGRPKPRAYLDYNASVPLRAEARKAMTAALDAVGNPSSVHAEGRAARALIEEARRSVAALVNASPRNVTFTSGATEAANLALNPAFARGPGAAPFERLIVGAGEHPSVLLGHRFHRAQVEMLPLRPDGSADLDWLEDSCRRRGRPLLALQAANNETGVIQPVAEAAAIVRAAGGAVFCDAVQLAGRELCDIAALGCDALSLSAHKIGGPKGAGAIVAASEEVSLGEALLRGGGQERGARAGTENVAAIAGFGAAALEAGAQRASERDRLAALRDKCVRAVRAVARDAVVFGENSPRLTNTLCFAPGVQASTLLIALDLEGVAASSGSACSSGKVTPSHVLQAMGVPSDTARCAIRVSLGWASSDADVERFGEALRTALLRMERGREAAFA